MLGQTEFLLSSERTSPSDTMENCSVVFLFGSNVDPVACTVDFLLNETSGHIASHKILKGVTEGRLTDAIIYNYKFQDTINIMKFKFGFKNEYYKNCWGEWVDMTALRNNLRLFSSLMVTVSIGVRYAYDVADNAVFNNPAEGSPYRAYLIDKKILPGVRYITTDGTIKQIGPIDGEMETILCNGKTMEIKSLNSIENLHNDRPYFTQRLANHITEHVAIETIAGNDNHKYDDLMLTMFNPDNTPCTDLDNLFVTVNGLFVDYTRSTTKSNVLYLPNVVKFSEIQMTGIKLGIDAPDNVEIIEHNGNNIINCEFDVEDCIYSMRFNVRIFKWNNVSVSKYINPLNTINMLKTEPSSADHCWLTTGLLFSEEIDIDKCILLCNNEIVPRKEYCVDPVKTNQINLLFVNTEFDILYSEMRRKLNQYLIQLIPHQYDDLPKITDYIGTATTNEEISEALEIYTNAMNEYGYKRLEEGTLDVHSTIPALKIVDQQFNNRNYRIVKFDTVEDASYAIKLIENHSEILLNNPVRNRITNKNWSPDDIIVINGLSCTLENLYDNVFQLPTTPYRPSVNGTVDGADAFKLQIVKEYH